MAVQLLAGGQMLPGIAGVQHHQRLVVREHELGSDTAAARHPQAVGLFEGKPQDSTLDCLAAEMTKT